MKYRMINQKILWIIIKFYFWKLVNAEIFIPTNENFI